MHAGNGKFSQVFSLAQLVVIGIFTSVFRDLLVSHYNVYVIEACYYQLSKSIVPEIKFSGIAVM